MKRQERAVLNLLKEKPHSTFELRSKGITHPAGRVMELRARGYLIDTIQQTELDGHGHMHYAVARYVLQGEPSQQV